MQELSAPAAAFSTHARRDEKQRFCADRLREAREQVVWAIAEGPWLMPKRSRGDTPSFGG